MTLGEIINSYRTEHRISMDMFAERSGMSKAYVSLLEKNKHPKTGKPIMPSIKVIKQCAEAMNEAVMTDQERSTGIKPIKLTAHYFRHNYCTILYYSGLSVGKAVELMGHADYKMIMNVYKHLDDEKECTIEKINNNVRLII